MLLFPALAWFSSPPSLLRRGGLVSCHPIVTCRISLSLWGEADTLPEDHLPVCPPLPSGAVNEKAWADTMGWAGGGGLGCSFPFGLAVCWCIFARFLAGKAHVSYHPLALASVP